MGEPSVDHVGDGFEAAMGVPTRPARFAGFVFDLTHLIHVDERVQLGGRHTGEGADDGEAFPSYPRGPVVIDRTGRSVSAGSGTGMRGRVRASIDDTVIAGMQTSLRAVVLCLHKPDYGPLYSV